MKSRKQKKQRKMCTNQSFRPIFEYPLSPLPSLFYEECIKPMFSEEEEHLLYASLPFPL